ncbi:hypothetical protein VVD49_21465 [Uliginosibacterium sp. H3]|uniref:Uncharacterized protein n=1 Tax=Uliginosibacterium silvisoli TaxID=3114758 RepID=A0ABU6KA59_9RHOO|nr:hypothetical protein [Uliginosibacterium sp. H3]
MLFTAFIFSIAIKLHGSKSGTMAMLTDAPNPRIEMDGHKPGPMKHLDAKTVGWIDASVSVLFAGLFAWAIYAANEAAADAVRHYGYNVDSGALVYIGAVIYLAPVACAFALASFSCFLRWRIKRFLHWLAVLGAIAPPLLSTAYVLAH